jgi:hypothetical protein
LPQLALFGRIHAGGRLVEQQKFGIGGKRPCDLEAPAIGVGQVYCGVAGTRRETIAEECQQLLGAFDRSTPLARAAGRAE